MTETSKWDDPWLMELPVEMKCLWFFINDRCDNSGVWLVNKRVAEVHLGTTIDWSLAVNLLEGRAQVIQGGSKWFLPTFIRSQYPSGLSRDVKNQPHQQIIRLLSEHGLPVDPSYFTLKEMDGGGGVENTPSKGVFNRAKDTDTDQPPLSISRKGSAEGKPVGGKIDTAEILAKFGLPSGPKDAREWAGGLGKTACVRSYDEAVAFIRWAISVCKKQNAPYDHFRHVRKLADEWANGVRDEVWQQKAAAS